MITFTEGFADESGLVTVHAFDPTTGEYIGEQDVYVSEGCGLPASATFDRPPKAKPKRAIIRDGDTWTVQGDHRGVVYRTADGVEVEHKLLGELPADLTTEPRPSPFHNWDGVEWTPDLVQMHAAKVAEINRDCQVAITSGVWSDALGQPHLYSSQLDDQMNLSGVILAGQDSPYGCRNEQGEKSFPNHTAEQLRGVGNEFTRFKLEHLQKASALKQQLDQALQDADLQALESISWITEGEQP